MDNSTNWQTRLHFLGTALLNELEQHAVLQSFPANTTLVREGQYVKLIPVVLQGAIKVFSSFEEKDLLLYYIQASESCIMSFAACQYNQPSRIMAITEEDSEVLLLPADKVQRWVKEYPSLNQLFFQQYNQRYTELIDTINHLLFNRLDERVYQYLLEKSRVKNETQLNIRHRQIAQELGTAREVVTRVMKRLEQEGRIQQQDGLIKIM